MHLIQYSINPVIPHCFATDRVKTRHDITINIGHLVCFVQLLGLGLQDILHPGSLWRNKRQTHHIPPAWWTTPSHLKPVSTDIYLLPWSTTGPSLLIKLTSLLDFTCLNFCILQVIKNWRWKGLRTRLAESVVQLQANSFTVFHSYLKHVMVSCVTCSTATCSTVRVDRLERRWLARIAFTWETTEWGKEKICEAKDASSVCQNTSENNSSAFQLSQMLRQPIPYEYH